MTRKQNDQRADSWRPLRRRSPLAQRPNIIDRGVRIFANVRKHSTSTWTADCPLCRKHTVTFGIDARGHATMNVTCPCGHDAVDLAFVRACNERWPKPRPLPNGLQP